VRVLVQRVQHASVSVGGETVGKVGRGFLALVGVPPEETSAAAARRAEGIPGETGIFGAEMRVELVNDGPVTILLET